MAGNNHVKPGWCDEVLDGVRGKPVKYRGYNLYPQLYFDEEGFPCDVDLSISGHEINQDQATLSNIDAIAVMVSLNLKFCDHDYIAAKLAQVARGKDTLPSIVADLLLTHGGERVRSDGFDEEE